MHLSSKIFELLMHKTDQLQYYFVLPSRTGVSFMQNSKPSVQCCSHDHSVNQDIQQAQKNVFFEQQQEWSNSQTEKGREKE